MAAFLRLSGLTAFSLSNDELSALARLQYDTVHQVIGEGVYVDFHPAGVQVFLYYWTKLFGFGEFAVRFPFAIMGVLSVYFLYRTGARWFGVATGLLAALSLAVLEYPLLYSQIARPYSPGLLFSLMAAFFWTQFLFDEQKAFNWKSRQLLYLIGFVLSVSACMYIHYFSFIFAGLLCFAGLFFLRRHLVLPYLLSGFFILLLYIPHFEIFLYQLSKGGVGGADGWLGPPKSDAFEKYIEFCFNGSWYLKSIFTVILIGSVLAFRGKFSFNKFHILSLLFFIIPFTIAYYYSIYKNPVFQHSVLLFSFPYLLLFIFSFIPADSKGFTLSLLFYSLLAAGMYSTVAENKYYTKSHFTEFRGIAKRIKYLDDKLGKENITRAVSVFNPYYINYYIDYYNHQTTFATTQIISAVDKSNFFTILDTSQTLYFLYAFSNVYDPPEFDMIIRSHYPWLLEKDSMLGSGLRLYSKNQVDTALNIFPAFSYSYGFESGAWENESRFKDSVEVHSGNYSMNITSGDEYSAAYKLDTKQLSLIPGSTVELSISAMVPDSVSGGRLVMSIDRGSESVLWTAADLSIYFRQPGKWYTVYLTAQLPAGLTGDEIVKVYCWNEKHEQFYVDDFKMDIYSPR